MKLLERLPRPNYGFVHHHWTLTWPLHETAKTVSGNEVIPAAQVLVRLRTDGRLAHDMQAFHHRPIKASHAYLNDTAQLKIHKVCPTSKASFKSQ